MGTELNSTVPMVAENSAISIGRDAALDEYRRAREGGAGHHTAKQRALYSFRRNRQDLSPCEAETLLGLYLRQERCYSSFGVAWSSFLSAVPLWCAVFTLAASSGILASYELADWSWFQRSGGLMVFAGAMMSARRFVRLGVRGVMYESRNEDWGLAGDTYEDEADRNSDLDLVAASSGPRMAIVGTFIASFGDLIG